MEQAIEKRRARPIRVALPVAGLAALWLTMLTLGAGPVDGAVLQAVYGRGTPLVREIALALTFLGDAPVLIAIACAAALVAAFWRKSPRLGLLIIAVVLTGRMLISAQKYGILRVRPSDQPHLDIVTNPSFPSGHAGNSMIVYLTIALVLSSGTRWSHAATIAAVILSLLIGLSRNVLGVHWPSDVVGGWSFGLLWVLVALPLAERALRPGERSARSS